MVTTGSRPPISVGAPAPDFVLPVVNQDGADTVSLAGYRGRAPILLAMMRGLYCAFCRRHIAQLQYRSAHSRQPRARCLR